MNDAISSQTALDPDRPWIEREEDLPANMNWLDTFFNPTGESSKLHFTRAWTVLFFTGVLTWAGLGLVIFLIGVVGGDTTSFSVFHSYLIAIVIGVSAIFSFVIHSRRLNHAKKSSLRAIIILVPLVLGSVAFLGGVNQKAAQYQELYDARAEFLADPSAWRDARLQERREQQARMAEEREAAERAEAEGGDANAEGEARGGQGQGQRGGRRGGRGGGPEIGGFSPENPLPSKESFILRPNLQSFYGPIVLLNGLIMIWSLLWVARVPNFGGKGKDPATDQLAYS